MQKNVNFKINFILLFIGVIFMGIFVGCTDNELKPSKKKPVSVSIWHYYNGAQKEIFDTMVTEFNETVGAEKGIVVEAYSQGTVNELTAKTMDAINKKVGAQSVPDVFAAYADTAYEINKMGMAADINQYLSKEERESYLKSYMREGEFGDDGSIKLFPIAKSTEVFVLNVTDWNKFALATGASEESFETWEGLAQVAKQYYDWTDSLTQKPDDGKAFFGRDAMANYMIIGSMQLGKELFQVHDGEVVFNIDKKVIRKLWDNYYIPYINGYYAAIGRFRSDDAKTGDIISLVGSTSGTAYFPTTVTKTDGTSYDIEAKVYPVPYFEGAKKYAVQQGAGMVITKSEAKKEYAATEFLKWFTEKEQNVRFAISSGYLPVKKDANEKKVLQAAMDSSIEKVSPILKQALYVGIETTKENLLYTNKAFQDGTAARDIVNESLDMKAKQDLKEINDLIANGLNKKEAVKRYDTDENFNLWYTNFENELMVLQN